jgi:hypothetical protein
LVIRLQVANLIPENGILGESNFRVVRQIYLAKGRRGFNILTAGPIAPSGSPNNKPEAPAKRGFALASGL